MVLIRFSNSESKLKALGFLPGRFAFKSWSTGEMLVPEEALAEMAVEGIQFSVEGPAKYDQQIPSVRNPAATSVQ